MAASVCTDAQLDLVKETVGGPEARGVTVSLIILQQAVGIFTLACQKSPLRVSSVLDGVFYLLSKGR